MLRGGCASSWGLREDAAHQCAKFCEGKASPFAARGFGRAGADELQPGCVLRSLFGAGARVPADSKRALGPAHYIHLAAALGLEKEKGLLSGGEARRAL